MPIALRSDDAYVVLLPGRIARRPGAPLLSASELEGALTSKAVAGRTLHELLTGRGATAAVSSAGAALADLHAQPLPGDVPSEGHGPQQEAAALADAMERVIRYAPAEYAAIGERARLALEALVQLRTPKRRLTHGDLDDQQIRLTDDGLVAFINLGNPRAGDPVLDLANLIAHIDAAVEPVMAGVLRDALLAGYRAPVRWKRRLAIYEESASLRLACDRAVGGDPGVTAALALPT
jgi:aminoglycoside phosphotransferase (APT) family kinase protein